MNIVNKLIKENSKRNVICEAVDKCKIDAEIIQFYEEYIIYLGKELNLNPSEAIDMAESNVGYMLGYYSDDTKEKWYKILNIGHPIFGDIK